MLISAWIAGDIAAQQFSSIPSVTAMALTAIASVLLWTIRYKIPAAFLFGLVWALALAAFRLDESLAETLERREVLLEGQIIGVPDKMDDGLRFRFRPETVLDPTGKSVPQRLRLSWYRNAQALKAGERWRLRVRLKRPHGYFNPGGLDYELWLFSQGIRATGYVVEDADNRKLTDAPPFSVHALRQSVFDQLSKILAGRETGGIVAALTLGTESAIPSEQWDVLRRTGTAHLVAISGSHISLVAGLVFLLVRWACAWLVVMSRPPQAVAAAAAFLAAWFYSALADFGIPTQRALIMIFVVMVGIIAQRNVRPLPTLALALLAVTLYDPLAVLAPGFWLSFGAVGLILLVVAGRLRSAGWWREIWKINWATSLGLAPVLLLFFQQVSLVSPLANLIAVPTIGFVLTPLCLLGALLLGVYEPLGEWILRLAETLLHWIWLLLQVLSAWPWAQWQHQAPPFWTLPFALIGAALLLAPRGIPARWLGVVLLIPALTTKPPLLEEGHFRLNLLDVGQGLAATVQTRQHVLVFDTGPRFSQSFDTGAAVVEPFLREQGVDKIDRLIVSHGDNDHIGGAGSLLKDFEVGDAYTSVPEQLPQTHALPCHAGQRWEWDGVKFEMLSPLMELANENNNSCVLRIVSPYGSALLTGDIQRDAEQQLVEHYGTGLKTDILIAPHHGSNTSSTAPFLAKVQPSWVLIPLGYLNRFGFPHPDVLRRYQSADASVMDTASAGAISLEPGSFGPTAYRETNGKYWNAKADKK